MIDPNRSSPFLTTKEAAAFLRVRRRTLDNWRWVGKGPAFHKHGQRVVYTIEDLLAFSRRLGGHDH